MSLVRYRIGGVTARAIADSVEDGVRDELLGPGTLLPPVRALAAELSVAPGTVAAAYRALRDKGLVESHGRRGTRVRARPPVAARSRTPLPVPPGALDLSTGQPDPALLPRLGPALRRLGSGAAPAPAELVLPPLLELGRARLAEDGVRSDAATVTSGALDALERVLSAHLRPGDSVAVEDPGWPNLLDLVAGLGLRVEPVTVDDDGPQPDALGRALRAGVRAVVVTSRAQNPTGAAVTAGRSAALRAVLAAYPSTLVLEDDHAADLAGVPLAPLSGVTRSWAFVRSASKPYGPDLRLALVAGDETTISRVEGRMRLGAGWVSTLLQHLVLGLWSDPAVDRVVRRAGAEYTARRETLISALAGRGVPAAGRTGINVWVPVADETSVVARLLMAGYVVAPGARFRLHSGPGIRITMSGVAGAQVGRLAEAVAAAVAPGRPTSNTA